MATRPKSTRPKNRRSSGAGSDVPPKKLVEKPPPRAFPECAAKEPASCQCCGTTKAVEVTGRTALCENCQSEFYAYCSVCEDYSYRGEECRHLSWADGLYTGAGATDGLDPTECHKGGVFVFFDLLDTLATYHGDNAARVAARAIRRNRFVTQMRGFLLSTPDMYLKERRHFDHGEETWCDFVEVRAGRDLGGFDEQQLVAGYNWLSTLDENTVRANALTTRWVNEWKRHRDAGRRPLKEGQLRVPYLSPLPAHHRDERNVPACWQTKPRTKTRAKKRAKTPPRKTRRTQ